MKILSLSEIRVSEDIPQGWYTNTRNRHFRIWWRATNRAMLHGCVTLVRRPRYPGRGWFSKDVGRACQKQPGVLARVHMHLRRGVCTCNGTRQSMSAVPSSWQDARRNMPNDLFPPSPIPPAPSRSSTPFCRISLCLSLLPSFLFIFTILLVSPPLSSLSLSFLRCPAFLRILADSSSRLLATGLPSYAALRPAPICANLRCVLSLSLSLFVFTPRLPVFRFLFATGSSTLPPPSPRPLFRDKSSKRKSSNPRDFATMLFREDFANYGNMFWKSCSSVGKWWRGG